VTTIFPRKLTSTLGALSTFSIVAAIATYAFILSTSRSLNVEDFSRFTTLWSAIYVLSGVILGALEPEVSRLVSAHQVRSVWLTVLLAASLLCLFLGCLGAASLFEKNPIDSRWSVGFGLPTVLLAVMTVQVVSRGILAGRLETIRYGLIAPLDAVFRLSILMLSAAIFGLSLLTSVWAMFGGSLIAAVVAWSFARRKRTSASVEGANERFSSTRFIHLVFATCGMTVLVSGVPLLARLFGSGDEASLSSIGAMSLVSRIPLLLVMGFESVLTSEFARHKSSGQINRQAVVRLGLIGPVVGVLGGAVGFVCGPAVVTLLTGPGKGVERIPMMFVCAGTGLCLGSLVLAPLMIAIRAHRQLSTLWLVSALVLGVLIAITDGTATAVAIAFLAACCTAQATMVFAAVSRVVRNENL
jgi:O-antigen/teichoic acid export membrane protein